MSGHDDALRERLAGVLSEHWEIDCDSDEWYCSCNHTIGDGTGDLDGRHRAHVADALLPVLADVRAEAAREALRSAAKFAIGCEHTHDVIVCRACRDWSAALDAEADRMGGA